MATNDDSAPSKPRGLFQFWLSHLIVAMTWIAVFFAIVVWLESTLPVGICLGVLIIAIVNDRRLTNPFRLVIVLPTLAYLLWSLLPKIY
jgi:hypothetical protein